MSRAAWVSLFASLVLLAPPAAAQVRVDGSLLIDGVDGRTGAFTLAYDDFKGSMAYRRTYVSSPRTSGVFGAGWGSALDTRLVEMPDNTILVVEDGNAGVTRYGAPSAAEGAAGEARLTAAVMADRLMTSARRETYLKRLAADPITRAGAVEAYRITGKAPVDVSLYTDDKPAPPAPGCSQMPFVIKGVDRDGRTRFARMDCRGREQQFGPTGKLMSYKHPGEEMYRLVDLGHPTGRVERQGGGELNFHRDGQVLTVTDEAGRWIKYTFAPYKGIVIATLTSGDEAYRYAYDQQDRMTEIIFVDTTRRLIAYDAEGRVSKITGRGGDVSTFTYAKTGRGCPLTEVYRTRPDGGSDAQAYEFSCVRKTIDVDALGAPKPPSPGSNSVMEAFAKGALPPPK